MTEVQIAIYDLSNGMARGLSAQFLGPQHAIDIIPHTAILAFGKEYFFGQGIEMCHPHEFRMTRGIHPIDIQSLGHTSCTQSEFETWCRAQGQGRFSPTSYDLLSRNCNNFTEEAAREGLRLGRGVPSWILEVPSRFLSSPLGAMIRPMLEQMQMTNSAPTNVSRQMNNAQSYTPATTPAVTATAAAVNPWADIPETSPAPKESNNVSPPETPFLDKQTALLSTDTGVVKLCLDRLNPAADQREILSKLENANYIWTHAELQSIHQILRTFMNEMKQASFALMLLRLAVMREAPSSINTDESQSSEFVADLLLKNESVTMSTRSMAWCVLSNSFGAKQLPAWTTDGDHQSGKFLQLVDRAVNDCDPIVADAPAPSHKALRQSAIAFLYNTSRRLTSGGTDGKSELTEAIMSILIGCLENLSEETDSISIVRRYMCIGQILKSQQFGTTAVGLTKDLGMLDADMIRSASHDEAVEKVAKEVASLL